MTGRSRRLASATAVTALLGLTVLACGGDNKTKTIKVPVLQNDTIDQWQQRALDAGLQVCTGKNAPERVVFAFDKADKDTEIAAEVVKQQVPTSANCSAYQSQVTDDGGSSSTTAKS